MWLPIGFPKQENKLFYDTFLQKTWPKNVLNSKVDAYESPKLMYNRMMDSMVLEKDINSWELMEK